MAGERRQNYINDHDLVIRIDENLKNLVSEFKSLKEIDIKEIKEGTKADIELLKGTKAEKKDVDDLRTQVERIDRTLVKYIAYASAGMMVVQMLVAILIKKYI